MRLCNVLTCLRKSSENSGSKETDAKRGGFLREWCAKAKASGIRQLQAMAATLLRHAKGVLSYYKTGLTSGN
jgi:transposase